VECELEALEIFCFDVVWPISIRVSIEADSVWLRWKGGRDTPREWEEEVRYYTDGRCKLGVCGGQRQRKGWGDCENVVEHGCLCRGVTNRTATATHSHA
jgi:hypothetical protein